jgi:hypothetical protein
LHVRNAKNLADVQTTFQAAKDNIDEVLSTDTLASLFKAGATLFGVGGAGVLIDGDNWLARQTQQGVDKIKFSTIPPVYSSAILLGALQNLPADVREAVAREVAAHLGKNFDNTVDAVRTAYWQGTNQSIENSTIINWGKSGPG